MKLVILGAGESGVGTAILALQKGYEVFVSDYGSISDKYEAMLIEHKIPYEQKQHSEDKILNADLVMKSPGIPEKAEIVKKIRANGIKIVSEIEFAYPYCNGKIVGITGSNGKTTTTNLVYHIFKTAGFNVGMAGNVGISFAYMVAKEPKDLYVVEISSFQLDDIHEFKCDIAILLNITPDHLDRYNYEMKNYVNSKFKITNNQTEEDAFIYCLDDEETMNYLKANYSTISSKKYPFSIRKELKEGGFIKENKLFINILQTNFSMLTNEITIKGKHNQYNSLAAGLAARHEEIRDEVLREAFMTFKTIPHRLESVLTIQGVEYINDSKATNVNSAWYALESMEKDVIWIAGGVDKGNDYESLIPLVKKRVKALVCLGVDNLKLQTTFSGVIDVIISTDSMKDAVRSASQLAEKGDAVLLSPCCASFDLFQNYEDRGDQFKECVRNL
ncbi:MAG: UDP-N-acetylmuramoyl-L-alanine--D-glutamate ligase [Chitinophagales bacterium]|nr:UDP-N-acetylmuramoyl-L-alanine--D-glutamate ligase [Chitinophagales bacterium]